MPTEQKRHFVRFPEDLLQKLEQRAPAISGGRSLSDAATTALTRYFAILEDGEREQRRLLTDNEMHYLRDILSGTAMDETSIPMLFAEVEDAESGYADKWEVDAIGLAEKLKQASLPALYAIADEIERHGK